MVDQEQFRRLMTVAVAVARSVGAEMWAEDIAAHTLKRYSSHSDEIDEPTAWVRRTAHNLAIDYRRREREQVRLPGVGTLADAPLPQQMQARSVGGVVAARDQLERALSVLNEIERDLLVGQNEGYSMRELAERYDYTEGSVRTKLTVARRKVREAFPDMDLD